LQPTESGTGSSPGRLKLRHILIYHCIKAYKLIG
jgi:hypothetical protein